MSTTRRVPRWVTFLVRHPEQPMFFVPAVLIAVLAALKLTGVMITVAWAIEAVLIILLGFFAHERSFRWSGLGLLLLCPAKALAVDIWKIHDTGVRYLVVIIVGVLVLLGSFVFAKNREALRKIL